MYKRPRGQQLIEIVVSEGVSPVSDSSDFRGRLNIWRSAARWAAGGDMEIVAGAGPLGSGEEGAVTVGDNMTA